LSTQDIDLLILPSSAGFVRQPAGFSFGPDGFAHSGGGFWAQ